jgi:hypothetical protein
MHGVRNWVEQSGKRHYKAVIVTPDQAFKILMALPESERVLTLVIAATGLRLSEALGLQWQGLCQSADQSSPGMGGQQSRGAHEDRAVRSSRHDESHVG